MNTLAKISYCFVLLIASSEQFVAKNDADLIVIGSYIRTELHFIKLYKATFLCEQVSYIQKKPKYTKFNDSNEISDFLLDPINRFSMKLEIDVATNIKDYNNERKAMQAALIRAGYEVDANWKLQSKQYLQKDLSLYVSTVIGTTKGASGSIFVNRKEGDKLILGIEKGTKAFLYYVPHVKNKRVSSRVLYFDYPDVIRGIISTYISRKNCSSALKDELPDALLSKYLIYFLKQ